MEIQTITQNDQGVLVRFVGALTLPEADKIRASLLKSRKIKKKTKNDKGVLVVFVGALPLLEAKKIRASLLTALQKGTSVEVACPAVTEIDISFPQLLIAARRTAAALNKTIVL